MSDLHKTFAQIKTPKGEIKRNTYHIGADPMFLVTQKIHETAFVLYEISADFTLTKLGQASSPIELEEKYKIYERITKKGKA